MNMPQIELKFVLDLNNKYYSAGLKLLLEQIFTTDSGTSLRPMPVASMQSDLESADIYAKDFAAGEVSICRPMFKLRKKNALLIVVSESTNPPHVNNFAECLKGCVVLRKADSVQTIREKIIQAWNVKSEPENQTVRCEKCRVVHLTKIEDIIAMYLCQEFPMIRIASILKIPYGRVSAYKRNIMAKFNLYNEAELVLFINKWHANISFTHKASICSSLNCRPEVKPVISDYDRELVNQVSEQKSKVFYSSSLI